MTELSPERTDLLLGAVVRHATELNRVTVAPMRRMVVRSDSVSVEVEWSNVPIADAGPVPVVESTVDDETYAVLSPTIGTFYRAPEPGAKPFVEVGDTIQIGQQIGIAEAMKLMNPIEADRAGRVVEVLVTDGQPVEFEQPLFVCAPLDSGE